MNNPFVSVIIPNYCHSAYLDQRIQSVLNQTYSNFEILILDDCSNDEGASRNVIERYRDNKYVSYIVYNDRNSGSAFRQWHKGFDLAKGDLIWIAESDDYCEPSLLETLVKEFELDKNCTLAFAGSLHVDSLGNPLHEKKESDFVERMSGVSFIQKYLCVLNVVENASSALFLRSAALSADIQYTQYRGAGDQLFWIELAAQGNVSYNHTCLNYFRQHGSNTTRRLYQDGTTFKELYQIFHYLCDKGYISSLKSRMKIKNYYLHWINDKVSCLDVRRSLIKLWDPYGLMRLYSFLVSCRDSFIRKA